MAEAEQLLIKVIDFVDKELCEVDQQDCDCCSFYDLGNCPIHLAKQYLDEEGLIDE